MKYYQGRANIDIPISGAKYIKENKNGGEIYNFKNVDGKVYAYIPFNNQININNLGAKSEDEFIEGITIVFCARHPSEGLIRVVGWHKNARLYRRLQKNSKGHIYHSVAKHNDVHPVPYTERVLKIPNVFGRNSLCYISLHEKKKKDLHRIEEYIARKGKPETINKGRFTKRRPFQNDKEIRLKVESKAIELAKKYFQIRHGSYNVKSVERDNVGWDLEVNAGSVKLRVEVKGLSGKDVNVQLTPNEFKAFSKKAKTYRLFVVTQALTKEPVCRIFEYQRKGDLWVGDDKSQILVRKIYSASLTLKN